MTGEQKYYWEYHWERWKYNAWEVFGGKGNSIPEADEDLQKRKLRRDWIGLNWMGESSSLTGTDEIAWPQLGRSFDEQLVPNAEGIFPHTVRSWSNIDKENLDRFYTHLSWILDQFPQRAKSPFPTSEQLAETPQDDRGKFFSHRERLSIPELVKRLVTLPELATQLKILKLDKNFREIHREAGYWTGWFMGDGDRFGAMLQELTQALPPNQVDDHLTRFTRRIRQAGLDFKQNLDLFASCPGRVIYSGGDDLFGILYTPGLGGNSTPLAPRRAYEWLLNLPRFWKPLQTTFKDEFHQDLTYSVGFVWVGHQVPQRDVLHHCREAEQTAKKAGRDRVAIRVVFNNGQWLQWACPWRFLGVLMQYSDREGKSWDSEPNWTHLYQDWTDLKARHAIQVQVPKARRKAVDETLALALFELYFGALPSTAPEWVEPVTLEHLQPGSAAVKQLTGRDDAAGIVDWLDGLVNVGWQLSN